MNGFAGIVGFCSSHSLIIALEWLYQSGAYGQAQVTVGHLGHWIGERISRVVRFHARLLAVIRGRIAERRMCLCGMAVVLPQYLPSTRYFHPKKGSGAAQLLRFRV